MVKGPVDASPLEEPAVEGPAAGSEAGSQSPIITPSLYGTLTKQDHHNCHGLTDLISVGDAGSDGDTEDDAESDGEECCRHVVENCSTTDLSAHPEVKLADGSNQTGNYQGNDETFQHVEEDLARVAHVVRLSRSVDTIAH